MSGAAEVSGFRGSVTKETSRTSPPGLCRVRGAEWPGASPRVTNTEDCDITFFNLEFDFV